MLPLTRRLSGTLTPALKCVGQVFCPFQAAFREPLNPSVWSGIRHYSPGITVSLLCGSWLHCLSAALQLIQNCSPSNSITVCCANGGTCITDGRNCVCPPGYTGRNCAEELCKFTWNAYVVRSVRQLGMVYKSCYYHSYVCSCYGTWHKLLTWLQSYPQFPANVSMKVGADKYSATAPLNFAEGFVTGL